MDGAATSGPTEVPTEVPTEPMPEEVREFVELVRKEPLSGVPA
jgi:hypothetical protein